MVPLLNVEHELAVSTSRRIHINKEVLYAIFKGHVEAAKKPVTDEASLAGLKRVWRPVVTNLQF